MSRPVKVLVSGAMAAIAVVLTACGTEHIAVPKASSLYSGSVLFNQRCSGCHTLAYADAHGSAANPRTAQANNGPNFDIRCERPIARVLYAIENGGFSGAIMPQNVVVGTDAVAVAKFVATYSGRRAPKVTGAVPCDQQSLGTVPVSTATATTASANTAVGSSTAAGSASSSAGLGAGTVAHGKSRRGKAGHGKKKSAHA